MKAAPLALAVAALHCVALLWAYAAHAACATYAITGSITSGYYLNNGCTAAVNVYSPCQVVTNNTGHTLFVPSYYPNSFSATGQNEWTSFLAHVPSGVAVSACNCTLPWGGTLSPGQSATAYQSSSVACHGSCASQTRTCVCSTNGVCALSGSYINQSCSVQACAPCSLPWGGSINDSQSVTAYAAGSVACGSSCSAQTRTCNNGSLSGSYTNQSCSVQACPCPLPWGGSINSGQSVAAYQYSSVSCGSSCAGQTRICSNGFLSGGYTNSSCSVGACGCANQVVVWGPGLACGAASGTLPSGQSETVSNTASGYTGSGTFSCSNGTWSYVSGTCTATATGCSATTTSWGTGCSGSVAALASGQAETVTNTASGYSGTTVANCNGSSWTYSGSTCGSFSLGGTWVESNASVQGTATACVAPGTYSICTASAGAGCSPVGSYCQFSNGSGSGCPGSETLWMGCDMAVSDVRLKTDITYVGRMNGYNIYEFSYKNDPAHHRYRGVIAQEVLNVPGAVVTMPNGYYAVNYGVLGVPFVRVR